MTKLRIENEVRDPKNNIIYIYIHRCIDVYACIVLAGTNTKINAGRGNSIRLPGEK